MNEYDMTKELIKASTLATVPDEVLSWLPDDAITRIYAQHQLHTSQMIYAVSLEFMEALPKGTFVVWTRDCYTCYIREASGDDTDHGSLIGHGQSRAAAIIDATLQMIAAMELEAARERSIAADEVVEVEE